MADNVAITAGSGTSIATDDVSSVHYQKVKLDAGADGASADNTTLDLLVPFDMTPVTWYVLPDQSGSIVVDLWMEDLAGYPPTVADTICGGPPNKPTVSAAVSASGACTGWTALVAGETLRLNVDSCTTITRATIVVEGTRA